ncbi:MAG: alpha/beta fold hydrolase [Thermodesulfobacteriota bacterium]
MNKNLLFAHGWATDFSVWSSFIDTLPKDYAISNPNLPGHGRGNATPWASPTLEPGVGSISEILAEIGHGAPPIGIGWSLGAFSLMKAELERPGSFRALILVGATPSFVSNDAFEFGQSRALVKRMILDLKSDPASALEMFYRLNFTASELASSVAKEFLKKYGNMRGEVDLISLANSLDTLYKISIADEISTMNLPVLIVHGSLDSVTPVGAAKYMAGRIKEARIKVIENAGHAPFLTRPEIFNQLTHDFISEIFAK